MERGTTHEMACAWPAFALGWAGPDPAAPAARSVRAAVRALVKDRLLLDEDGQGYLRQADAEPVRKRCSR